ncbi:MAG: ATP-binding protein [Bacillota bacterium]
MMHELSLSILDLVQNCIAAQANWVLLEIIECSATDKLLFRISDNGKGMDKETQKKVLDPFVTSRTTRRVGLGLPLIDMTTKMCGGSFSIESEVGKGTIIEALFQLSHIDRPPMGKLADTIKSLIILNPELDFNYKHIIDDAVFTVSTKELVAELEGISLQTPEVLLWLNDYIKQGIANLSGGKK